MFPYTTDVMSEYPYIVHCISETESDQWEKYRWLCNNQKLNWEEDFIAVYSPILARSRRSLIKFKSMEELWLQVYNISNTWLSSWDINSLNYIAEFLKFTHSS